MFNREKKINFKGLLKHQGAALLAISIVIAYSFTPFMLLGSNFGLAEEVYAMAENQITAKSNGDESGIKEGSAVVSILIENGRADPATISNIKFTVGGSGITVKKSDGDLTIPGKGSHTISFPVEISRSASEGSHTCNFSATVTGLSNVTSVENQFIFEVFEKSATLESDKKDVAALNIVNTIYPSQGFTEGNNNHFSVSYFNSGNSTIKNAKVQLTLPEGLTVYNGSNTENLGYIPVGDKKKSTFTITVDKSVVSKNYPIGVAIKGLSSNNSEVSIEKTFYVPVSGKDDFAVDNVTISNVSIPSEMSSGENFNLSFNVNNTGSSEISSMKIMVEPAEGLINKSKNIFIDKLAVGESKSYSTTLYTFEGAEQKSYPIKITASPTTGESKDAVIQYATVTILSDGTTAKKPQLMIDNYSYGGSAVQAGTDFYLNLGLFNTSGKTFSNVKVSLSNADGVFVPVDGSSSFFIDSIKAKGHLTKSIRLTTKPQAEQKTTPITVTMSYEVGSGDPLEATDTIAIPITQKSRLIVDDIVPPMEIYVGQQGTCEIEFYNMGKTPLNNLRVNCEGDFDVMESNSYYAGNMESGKSDSYRFNYIPREMGTMEGTITFTFEDGNGEAQFLEVPFSFDVMDVPVFEDDPSLMEQEQKPIPWALIIAGVVVVVATVGGILFKKHRKKKLNKALEIEDSYDIDMAERTGGETMDSSSDVQ